MRSEEVKNIHEKRKRHRDEREDNWEPRRLLVILETSDRPREWRQYDCGLGGSAKNQTEHAIPPPPKGTTRGA
jgi:hypothetical protein